MLYKNKHLVISILACMLLTMQTLSSSASANELTWAVGLDNEVVYQDVYSDEQQQSINSTNFIVRPQLSLNFTSKRANAFWRATHNNVSRSLEDADVTNNYTNYAYGGSVTAIQNLLTFTASGALNYQSASANGFLVDSFLLNAENLTKTRSNRFGADFTLPRGDYFGHSSQINYSTTESERRENSFNQLNSDILSVNTKTYTGNDFERFSAQVDSSFSVSDRSVNGDYTNRRLGGLMSYRFISNLGFLVTANHEANQVKSANDVFLNVRQFNSAGAGLVWQQAENKFISLTWNRADSDAVEADEDNKGFIGANVNWQFTPRTEVSADYTRRFFGESGNFSFQHRLKKFRTQITYSEEVTTFSRLIAEPENLGVFICTDGISDLAACFQPSSLNYQPQPNEQFVQFSVQNPVINDDIILRKGLSWQLGTELRRTKVSLSGRYFTNEYLEVDRLSRTYSASTSLAFAIGQKTNISWTTDAAITDDIFEGAKGTSEVLSTKLSLDRDMGRYFNLSLNFSYLQRETEGRVIGNGGFSGLTGDLKDRRVSLDLKYNLTK
ncbi:TIGR03016 family PEP-CTERM system-associated outer membrane protein [Glaciecola sp. 33A]|nr:TIGR03016 family PEP-CTERM system-associated outer membrane protein [Glaciecola sp. 33A]